MYNLKVISQNVPDFSSAEALLADIIKPGMTDEEKCTAVWRAVYEHRFWNPSSRGELRRELGGTDPIIGLNCFMPTICQQDSEMCIALWGLLGYSARMWQLGWHTTGEVFYGGKWRHFDATVGRISKDENGEIGSVTLGQSKKGRDNWMRPESYISATEDIALGHRMPLTLRRNESFTRYWYPLSKDPDYWCASSDGNRPDDRIRRGQRRLHRAMDLKERRFKPTPDDAAYGNGRWIFEPDFAGRNWRQLLADEQNLSVSASSGMYAQSAVQLHPDKPGCEAYAVFRLKSPYIFSGGWVSGFFTAGTKDDQLEVLASVDNGHTWKTLWKATPLRESCHTIGLRDAIRGKFDCLVKIRMLAARRVEDVRVGGLRFEGIVMNSPFALPALKLGKTDISVSADPQLDSLCINPCVASPEYRSQVVEERNTISSMEAGISMSDAVGLLAKKAGEESYIVLKVTVPTEMRWVRWGGRFPDDNQNNKLYYSFDGKAWTEKPWSYKQRVKNDQNERRAHITDYEELDDLPKGTKTIWLKYWFFRHAAADNPHRSLLTPGIRIDVDYVPVHRGPRPPVEVTYCWTEYHGQEEIEKTHTKVIDTYPTDYGIIVKGTKEPTMNWLKVQLQGAGPASSQPGG